MCSLVQAEWGRHVGSTILQTSDRLHRLSLTVTFILMWCTLQKSSAICINISTKDWTSVFFNVQDLNNTAPWQPEPVNKVNDYQKTCYLSTPEAAWHILGFEIMQREPSVQCLPVHLSEENMPQFWYQGNQSNTSLLDWYFLWPVYLAHLHYEEYYEKYILYPFTPGQPLRSHECLEQSKQGVIQRKIAWRHHSDKIVHIDTMPLWSDKVFYLHSLLLHKCASSFKDLCTINGHVFGTFHKAASDLGLFNNHEEGFLMLQEAVDSLRTSSQLHFFFAQILLEGYPMTLLWEKFKKCIVARSCAMSQQWHQWLCIHTTASGQHSVTQWQASRELWALLSKETDSRVMSQRLLANNELCRARGRMRLHVWSSQWWAVAHTQCHLWRNRKLNTHNFLHWRMARTRENIHD